MITLEDLGIRKGMSKENISKQIFQVRKRLINRQNSPNIEKRAEAEMQLALINKIENILGELHEGDKNNFFYLKTLFIAEHHHAATVNFKNTLIGAINDNQLGILDMAYFINTELPEKKLGEEWVAFFMKTEYKTVYKTCIDPFLEKKVQLIFQLAQQQGLLDCTDSVENSQKELHNANKENSEELHQSKDCKGIQKTVDLPDFGQLLSQLATEGWMALERGFYRMSDKVEKFITSEKERKSVVHNFLQNIEVALVGGDDTPDEEQSDQDVFYKRQ